MFYTISGARYHPRANS